MKKIIIIGGSIVAVAALAYFGYKWYQKRKSGAPAANKPLSSNPATNVKPQTATATAQNVGVPFNTNNGFTAEQL